MFSQGREVGRPIVFSVSNRMVRVGFTGEVTAEKRPEGGEGVNEAHVRGESLPVDTHGSARTQGTRGLAFA